MVISLWDTNGRICERHECAWCDVLAFVSILEQDCGYSAVLVERGWDESLTPSVLEWAWA